VLDAFLLETLHVLIIDWLVEFMGIIIRDGFSDKLAEIIDNR